MKKFIKNETSWKDSTDGSRLIKRSMLDTSG